MAVDAMTTIAAEKRLSFIEYSFFFDTLFNQAVVIYDLDHMVLDLFSQLPAKAQQTIEMDKGDVLFHQSQPTSGLYRVVEGSVTLQRTSVNGDMLVLHRATAGGTFAEASVFSDTYHCDAICTEAGRVVKIAKKDVNLRIATDPVFSAGFTKHLAVQVQQYRAQIELLAIGSAKDRVFAAVQAGYFDTTIKGLASRINLTHEACYRALRALCNDGRMIQTERGKYVVSQRPDQP